MCHLNMLCSPDACLLGWHLKPIVVKMVSVQECSESTGHAEAVQMTLSRLSIVSWWTCCPPGVEQDDGFWGCSFLFCSGTRVHKHAASNSYRLYLSLRYTTLSEAILLFPLLHVLQGRHVS